MAVSPSSEGTHMKTGIISTLGGRKFCSFAAASIGLVALHLLGIELSADTLESITLMFMAFAAGNGVEHLATTLSSRSGAGS